jgi:hypothetical protein
MEQEASQDFKDAVRRKMRFCEEYDMQDGFCWYYNTESCPLNSASDRVGRLRRKCNEMRCKLNAFTRADLAVDQDQKTVFVGFQETDRRVWELIEQDMYDALGRALDLDLGEWEWEWMVRWQAQHDFTEMVFRSNRRSSLACQRHLPPAEEVWKEMSSHLQTCSPSDIQATSVRWFRDSRLLVSAPESITKQIELDRPFMLFLLNWMAKTNGLGITCAYENLDQVPGGDPLRYLAADSFGPMERRLLSDCKLTWNHNEYVIYAPHHAEELLARKIDDLRKELLGPVSVVPVPFIQVPIHVYTESFQVRQSYIIVL